MPLLMSAGLMRIRHSDASYVSFRLDSKVPVMLQYMVELSDGSGKCTVT